jgi:hypothetical protein
MKIGLIVVAMVAVLFAGGAVRAADPVPLPPKLVRPGVEAGPTKVSVAIWVSDIAQIDSVAQTFNASFAIGLGWKDPRLAHAGPGAVAYAPDDIWHPEWIVANDDGSVKQTLAGRIEVLPDGTAFYRQRFVGPFLQKLDLRRFPFDQHQMRARFVVVGHRPEELQFVAEDKMVAGGYADGTGMASEVTLVDWKVDGPRAYTDAYHAAPGIDVAGYTFEFTAVRRVQHYLIKVMLPLLLIVMMSWTVFWIDPTNGGSQISVAVTSMLTLIAYRFAVGAEVPHLPYLTRLDAFILASSLLVFFSLIEVMITSRLATDGRVALARSIDRRCRVLFPLVFAVCTLVIFLRN